MRREALAVELVVDSRAAGSTAVEEGGHRKSSIRDELSLTGRGGDARGKEGAELAAA